LKGDKLRKKGFMLLESVISMAIIGIISFTMLSSMINSYRYTRLGEDKIHMTSIAGEYIEKIKNSSIENIMNYKEKNFTVNGYNINTDIINLDNLNNCIKIKVKVTKDKSQILVESYKVIN
jgi:type II secretory pathway pseudopilin PulG